MARPRRVGAAMAAEGLATGRERLARLWRGQSIPSHHQVCVVTTGEACPPQARSEKMSNQLGPEVMSPAERLEEAASLLARGILRTAPARPLRSVFLFPVEQRLVPLAPELGGHDASHYQLPLPLVVDGLHHTVERRPAVIEQGRTRPPRANRPRATGEPGMGAQPAGGPLSHRSGPRCRSCRRDIAPSRRDSRPALA